MELTPLTAISPIDGRYRNQLAELGPFFSEYGLIRYRVMVEVRYFQALCKEGIRPLNNLNPDEYASLNKLFDNFTLQQAEQIKATERITNHDVKAVEYFIKEHFTAHDELSKYVEFIHFGLTSQDINNTAIPLLLKEALHGIYLPRLKEVLNGITEQARTWKDIAMLARTHGQAASPTRLGKEWEVFAERVRKQLVLLEQVPFSAKFGGATGNFNAHAVAYPDHDWYAFADQFVGSLGLTRSHPTTQVEHYDNLAALFDALRRINTILTDFARDVWQYISMGYFQQKIKAGEVGSSAMPHKVNPIDFENAEGNLGMANAGFGFLSEKLPISRLQRDLTDSTVLRNIGVPVAHSLLALNSLKKGLNKLVVSPDQIQSDLDNNWAVLAEAIQTILRKEGYEKPYELLKNLTRNNQPVTEQSLKAFINQLNVSNSVKSQLAALRPENYAGQPLNEHK